MKRARRVLIIAVAIGGFSIPSILTGQVPYVWVLPTVEAENPATAPFAELLAHGEALSLTPTQVAQIERVRNRLIEENRPLLAQIRDAELYGVDTEQERSALAAVRSEFDDNAGEAEREVREILLAEQVTTADSLLQGASWTYPLREETQTPRALAAERAVADVALTVENHSYYDANVYAISGGRRVRIGFIQGLRTLDFVVPDELVMGASGIRFEVVQIPRLILPNTPEISVFPGDHVVLRIPPS
jgi:hypothetical protein